MGGGNQDQKLNEIMIIETQIAKFHEMVQYEIAALQNEIHRPKNQEVPIKATQDQYMKLNMVHNIVDNFKFQHKNMKQDLDTQQQVFEGIYENNLRQNSATNPTIDMNIKKLEDIINNLSQSINLLKSQNSLNATPKTTNTLATYSASLSNSSTMFQGEYPMTYLTSPQTSQIFVQPKGIQCIIYMLFELIVDTWRTYDTENKPTFTQSEVTSEGYPSGSIICDDNCA